MSPMVNHSVAPNVYYENVFIRYVRNRIDHWCAVEPGNPNPRVHRSSGKLGEASFPTGTVDPRVGISLSPLNTNDGFSLSTSVVC